MFWKHVIKGGPNDCWIWKGAKQRSGHGRFGLYGHMVGAHRYAWFLATGSNPPYVLHRCNNPSCVNAGHLYEGDMGDNQRDRWAANRYNEDLLK